MLNETCKKLVDGYRLSDKLMIKEFEGVAGHPVTTKELKEYDVVRVTGSGMMHGPVVVKDLIATVATVFKLEDGETQHCVKLWPEADPQLSDDDVYYGKLKMGQDATYVLLKR